MQNKNTCVIMQPTVYPWLGYFDLIDQATKFVIYDDVQFSKQSWQVRNKIKTSNGPIFIFIPVKKSNLDSNINEILIDNSQPWRKKHLNSLFLNYKKADYFLETYTFLENFYGNNQDKLLDFTANFIIEICKKIGIKTELIFSSNLIETLNFRNEERLVKICQSLDCQNYLSTIGSSAYIEANTPGGEIVKNGLDLRYHQYEHPQYNQIHGYFEPFMGIIDLIFNVGFDNSLAIIRSGRIKF